MFDIGKYFFCRIGCLGYRVYWSRTDACRFSQHSTPGLPVPRPDRDSDQQPTRHSHPCPEHAYGDVGETRHSDISTRRWWFTGKNNMFEVIHVCTGTHKSSVDSWKEFCGIILNIRGSRLNLLKLHISWYLCIICVLGFTKNIHDLDINRNICK